MKQLTPSGTSFQSLAGRRAAALVAAACLRLAAPGLAGEPGRGPTYSEQDCIHLAIQQNPDVLAAVKAVEGARAGVTQADAGFLPSITSSGDYQQHERYLATQANLYSQLRTTDYTLDARIVQNLYSAGAVRSRVAIAKLGVRTADLAYQAALDAATLAARTAFYQCLAGEADIGIRQQAVTFLEAQLKDQRDRLAAGTVGQLNVNRAQVTLVNEEPALEQARYDLRAAYVALSQVLSIPYREGSADAPFHVRGTLEYHERQISLDECLAKAEALRPEIESHKLDLDVLNRTLTVEKSATRPRLDAFAAYDVYSQPSKLAQQSYFDGYTVGVAINWQIFDGFATRGRVRAVQARQGAAVAALAAIRQQVQGEVRSAYYQLQQAVSVLGPQTKNVDLAKETLQLTETNFGAALTTQLDILQGRVDLTRAQSVELGARLSYNLALARLEHAVGGSLPAGTAHGAGAPPK